MANQTGPTQDHKESASSWAVAFIVTIGATLAAAGALMNNMVLIAAGGVVAVLGVGVARVNILIKRQNRSGA